MRRAGLLAIAVFLAGCPASHDAGADAAVEPTCDGGPALPPEVVGGFFVVGVECSPPFPPSPGPRWRDDHLDLALFSVGDCGGVYAGVLDGHETGGQLVRHEGAYRYVSEERAGVRPVDLRVTPIGEVRPGAPALLLEELGLDEPWRAWAIAESPPCP